MFVVGFGDGLGNQMFQYAFYKAIKRNYINNIVKMDICYIYGPPMHNGYELDDIFSIKGETVRHYDALKLADYFPRHLKRYYLFNKMQSLRRVLVGTKDSFIHPDDPTAFYPEIFRLNPLKSYYLRGNWINENYFRDFRDELIEDFSFKRELSPRNQKYKDEMENSESVSIHLRRGDYAGSILKNLEMDYYRQAIGIIEEQVKTPTYFLFSDDKAAAEREFAFLNKKVIVQGNYNENSYVDMQLMSYCNHNIIANSTFSFWGAYLNTHINRVIIAPNKAAEGWCNPFACSGWILVTI